MYCQRWKKSMLLLFNIGIYFIDQNTDWIYHCLIVCFLFPSSILILSFQFHFMLMFVLYHLWHIMLILITVLNKNNELTFFVILSSKILSGGHLSFNYQILTTAACRLKTSGQYQHWKSSGRAFTPCPGGPGSISKLVVEAPLCFCSTYKR